MRLKEDKDKKKVDNLCQDCILLPAKYSFFEVNK